MKKILLVGLLLIVVFVAACQPVAESANEEVSEEVAPSEDVEIDDALGDLDDLDSLDDLEEDAGLDDLELE